MEKDSQHVADCVWERTTAVECEYRNTHHYCPHPEHACTCPPRTKSLEQHLSERMRTADDVLGLLLAASREDGGTRLKACVQTLVQIAIRREAAATAALQVDDCDAARVQRLEAQMQGLLNSLATSQQEVERLRAGNFTPQEFQNLCHNLDESDREVFVAGCLEYQRKLFGDSATAAPVEQSDEVTLRIPTCGKCPFVDHSGAFTSGGAQPICGHRDAPNTFAAGVAGDERFHWKYRQIALACAPPEKCPLRQPVTDNNEEAR